MSKVDPTTLVSQAEYARHRGCSREAVRRKIANKQIDAFGPEKLVCPQLADAQWKQRVRARADSGLSDSAASPDARSGMNLAAELPTAPASEEGEYSVNRARRERFEADLAEIKLREQQGTLVQIAEVRAEIGRRIGQLRTNLLQLPTRLAPLVAVEADQAKVWTMLDNEVRSILLSSVRDE